MFFQFSQSFPSWERQSQRHSSHLEEEVVVKATLVQMSLDYVLTSQTLVHPAVAETLRGMRAAKIVYNCLFLRLHSYFNSLAWLNTEKDSGRNVNYK